ncbi:MAG: RNase H-like domain-containing protein, partial [Candidatus Thiodiazotropha sp.]
MCKTKVKNLNAIKVESESESEDNYEEIFVLGRQDATVTVSIEGKSLNILVDSGASVNAIDQKLFHQLKSPETIIEKSDAKIYPYGAKTPLELLGKANFKVQVSNKTQDVIFQIIKGSGKPLLGHKTATDLGLLHIGLTDSIAAVSSETDTILRSFQDRFEGLGKLKDFQLRLYIDESVKPVAQPARRIPFKMQGQVDKKLIELEKLGVIEKVEGPTPWVSALVPIPKPNNDVRLCVDMRCANKAIQRERFPMPNVEETLEQMNGASVFSKLDLTQAFHQIELEESSRYITTFATNNSLYRYTRLFFGVNSAPETYQRIIQQVIQDIPGCKNIADDIIIYAANQQEHDKILKMLLARLREKNLTVNKNKCEFNKSELKFMGHTLSSKGLKIDESKVQAVRDTPPPTNPTEVKSFLGLVNFCSKFIPNFATLAEPLRKLTRKEVAWHWGREQQHAFDTLKQRLISADVMAYYNTEAETQLLVDGSPFGLGAILNQKQSNGEFRPVAYASRTLNPVERRYSQTEREALAILWAIQRFNVYLYGSHFVVYTDHRPLERIFSSTHEAPARIQKWVLKLQPYSFSVRYVRGFLNAADVLSRASTRACNENSDDNISCK